jgi:hypothetical protein
LIGKDIETINRIIANDQERLSQFIRDLFLYVGNLENVPEEWVTAWTERGLRLADPIPLFAAFVDSKGIRERRAKLEEGTTRWPHGHFYSPVVNRREILEEWPRLSQLRAPAAVDLRAEAQAELLIRISKTFDSMPFLNVKTPQYRFYYNNPSYKSGDVQLP